MFLPDKWQDGNGSSMMRIFALLSFLLLLVSACTKQFLETDPSSSTYATEGFKTTQDFESALNGCYSGLQAVGYYGRNFPVIGDVLSNNVVPSETNLSWFVELYNFAQTSSDQYLLDFWKSAYEVINRTNILLRNAKTSDFLAKDERNYFVSQALAIRALAHFDLFRTFSNNYICAGKTDHLAIPLILDSTYIGTTDPVGPSTAEEVMSHIVADLKHAKSIAEAENISPFRFNKLSMQALLARCYLFKGEYRNAFLEADSVIQSGMYALVVAGDIVDGWEQEYTTESIFSIKFTSSDYNAVNSLGYLYGNSGYGAFVPSTDLLSLYSTGDRRKNLVNQGFCTKYDSESKAVGNANFPVIRFSEMYLIVAEGLQTFNVKIKGSSVDESIVIDYLDNVKRRSNPNMPETELSGTELYNEILDEYQREFAFEGQQFFVRKRLELGVYRADCKSMQCNVSYSANPSLFAMPIPQSEQNANINYR